MSEEPRSADVRPPVIELSRASIGYGDRPVVRDVEPAHAPRRGRRARRRRTGRARPPWCGRRSGSASVSPARSSCFGMPARQFRRALAHRLRAAAAHRRRRGAVDGDRGGVLRPAAPAALVVTADARPTAAWWPGDRGRGPGRAAPRAGGDAVGRPAAPRADRPRPGRRARGADHGRTDCRGRRRRAPRLSGHWSRLVDDGLTLLVVTHDIAPLAPILTRVVRSPMAGSSGTRPPRSRCRQPSDARKQLMYAHPGHDPHHIAAGETGPPGRPVRPPVPGWLGDPGLN